MGILYARDYNKVSTVIKKSPGFQMVFTEFSLHN